MMNSMKAATATTPQQRRGHAAAIENLVERQDGRRKRKRDEYGAQDIKAALALLAH